MIGTRSICMYHLSGEIPVLMRMAAAMHAGVARYRCLDSDALLCSSTPTACRLTSSSCEGSTQTSEKLELWLNLVTAASACLLHAWIRKGTKVGDTGIDTGGEAVHKAVNVGGGRVLDHI